MGNGEINGEFNFAEHTKGKYAVLFFYPLDFTFVCPTELIAFDKRLEEFQKRGVEVIGVSIDSHYTHNAWRNTPVNQGGIGPVRYPLVADLTHDIISDYGIATPNGALGLRASFLIDKTGMVKHQVVNDLSLGRDINEMLRMVDALQFTEKHGEVCPAGWKNGDDGMQGTPDGVANYLSSHAVDL
jgi:peroxiredoxin (alkyl hydroperoxide reductase subunit C)